MSSIARDIAKPPPTIFSYLLYHGGISPRTRTRRAICLSAEEGESISRGLASGASYRAIGRQLGRSASTIAREAGRNGGPGRYRAYDAEQQFLKRGLRPKPYLLSREPELRGIVIRLLEADWSPEQISGWLKRHSPDGKIMCVSHETIYRSLFVQARGVLRKELKKTYGPSECFAIPDPIGRPSQAAFPTPSQFVLVLRRSKTAHCQGIGKAILFRGQTRAPLPRSSTKARGSPCFAGSRTIGPKP
ncbi:hypothetical protein LMG6001_01254 [Achromobacter insolitus]|nr:hypothetical protein LMG6001_01254 [Achromobacter insolitus]